MVKQKQNSTGKIGDIPENRNGEWWWTVASDCNKCSMHSATISNNNNTTITNRAAIWTIVYTVGYRVIKRKGRLSDDYNYFQLLLLLVMIWLDDGTAKQTYTKQTHVEVRLARLEEEWCMWIEIQLNTHTLTHSHTYTDNIYDQMNIFIYSK